MEAAKVLAGHSIESISDVVGRFDSRESREHSDIAREWLMITGQSSALTWSYFLMLVGVPGVKADRMIVRFVTHVLERPKEISRHEASRLIEEVADIMCVNYIYLDHTIWRFQSGAPTSKKTPPLSNKSITFHSHTQRQTKPEITVSFEFVISGLCSSRTALGARGGT